MHALLCGTSWWYHALKQAGHAQKMKAFLPRDKARDTSLSPTDRERWEWEGCEWSLSSIGPRPIDPSDL